MMTMRTLKSREQFELMTVKNDHGLCFRFLPNGGLHSIQCGDIMINQVLGNPLEGGMNAVYLRLHEASGISWISLVGPASQSHFDFGDGAPAWHGEWNGLKYCCRLLLGETSASWFWRVDVENMGTESVCLDVVYVQDIGLAVTGALRSNEAYTSQYIDHQVARHPRLGPVLLSRQNQEQGVGIYPWLMQGGLQPMEGCLTDGFDFYGLSFRKTGLPEALQKPVIGNVKRQYEFACAALQTKQKELAPSSASTVVFFGRFVPTHPEASSENDLGLVKEVANEYAGLPVASPPAGENSTMRNLFNAPEIISGDELSEEEMQGFFPDARRHEERDESGTLLSFFSGRDRYAVLPAKELLMERPHGHILRAGQSVFPDNSVFCSTNYMYGLFHAQITLGNTSFSKLFSVPRNALNVSRACGQRIFIEDDGAWKLLGMPSAYETGISSTRWIYKTSTRTLTITVWASSCDSAIFTNVDVQGAPCRLLLTGEVVMGNGEFESCPTMQLDATEGVVTFRPDPAELLAQRQPGAVYKLVVPEMEKLEVLGGDELLFEDATERNYPYLAMRTMPVQTFDYVIVGSMQDEADAEQVAAKYQQGRNDVVATAKEADAFWSALMNHAELRGGGEKALRLNDLLKWYVHNAMIHYTAPHGLEQYSGAAWGTRDVCQGPVEFLLAFGRYAPVADILKLVFEHQYQEDGSWPQWFMFLEYANIQHFHCHGDIIIWPLKALCDYLETANDFTLLNARIPYTQKNGYAVTEETYSLVDHVRKLIDYIESECIDDTALICYGDGDWDDTLQPADSTMKTRMVSGWTVELVYQTFRRFANLCDKADLAEEAARVTGLADRIRQDFNQHIIRDGVVSGFVYFDEQAGTRSLLHPSDRVTNIQYRLLPMTRGIISEIFTPEQAADHYAIVRDHLLFPDGVHLMNRAVPYNGGVQKYFRRAETASNFGREIGLQYVHAHIRYAEALAKLGKADELLHALLVICPLQIQKSVPNAVLRQSNAYFSSSDGDFPDRYEVGRRFDELRQGTVQVKGGWRIYSSGPGIYINQVVSQWLGIRFALNDLVLDPVLAKELDGLEFQTLLEGY
ncbi:MAG: cellobiose phosphorylase, partial [Kiritimatiellae bacterium]|nr:cellobiose phosphorylase [Kiritimatiellia bacterium]